MLYYKVNKGNDNYQFGTKKRKLYYVENELFTEKECEKYNVDKNLCTAIHVPKTQTYWMFGARFMMDNAQYHYAMFDYDKIDK